MKKLLLTLFLIACYALPSHAIIEDYTLEFVKDSPLYGSSKNYRESSFTTTDGFLKFSEFNNGQKVWNYIRAGYKGEVLSPYFQTQEPSKAPISEIVLTLNHIRLSEIQEAVLYVADNKDFNGAKEYSFKENLPAKTIAYVDTAAVHPTADCKIAVTDPAAGQYVKVQFTTKGTSGGSSIGITKIQINYVKPDPFEPSLSWKYQGADYNGKTLTIEFDDKDDLTTSHPEIAILNKVDADLLKDIKDRITYTSSDPNVVAVGVDDNGNLTMTPGIAGTTTITAKVEGYAYILPTESSFTITINPSEEKSLAYSSPTYEWTYGDAEIFPGLSIGGKLTPTYSSSNTDVATVDPTGKVTIVGAGPTTITATAEDGAYTASYILTVNKFKPELKWTENGADITSITLSSNETLADEHSALTLFHSPEADNITVALSSGDSKVATIDNDGKITLGGAQGTVTYTATYPGTALIAGVTATLTITVDNTIREELLAKNFTTSSGSGYVDGTYTSPLGITFKANMQNSFGRFMLTATGNTSGVIVSANPNAYIVKKITVVDGLDGNSNPGVFDIYAKAGSYTDGGYTTPGELYGDTRGTKIGSTTGTSTALFPETPEYLYFGIRSNKGTVYASKIIVRYEAPVKIDADLAWENVVEGAFTYDYDPQADHTLPSLAIGNNETQTAKIKEAIIYTSSNPTVATITAGEDGLPVITLGTALGETTITAKIAASPYFNEVVKSFTFKAIDNTPKLEWTSADENWKVEGDNKSFTMTYGDKPAFPHLSIGGGLKPVYTSENEAVATIESDGTIKVVGSGETTITAAAGEINVSYTLKVAKATVKIEYPANIEHSVGEEFTQPVLTVTPEALTEEVLKAVVLKSSNETLATIVDGKIILAKDELGETTITASIPGTDNKFEATSDEINIKVENTISDVLTLDSFGNPKSNSSVNYTSPKTKIAYNGYMAKSTYTTADAMMFNVGGGIVATANPEGYILKSIKIDYDGATPDGRVFDIYGKTGAYAGYADLYGEDSKVGTAAGNLIGSVAKTAPSVVTPEAAYNFIGMRPQNTITGLHHINKITIKYSLPIASEINWAGTTDGKCNVILEESEGAEYPTVNIVDTRATVRDMIEKSLVYTSSKPSVATITVDENNNPIITPKAAGSTTITASIPADNAYNLKPLSCEYTLVVVSTQESLEWASTDEEHWTVDGDKKTFNVAYGFDGEFPHISIGGDLKVEYSTSDDKVATVNDGHVEIVGAGTATITATGKTETNEYTATYDLVVAKATPELTWGEALSVDIKDSFTQPELSITPASKAGEIKAALTFESDNEAAVKVDEEGNIEIVGTGTAKITATLAESDNFNAASTELTISVHNYFTDEITLSKFGSPNAASERSYTAANTGITYKAIIGTTGGNMVFNAANTNGLASVSNPDGYTIKSIVVEYAGTAATTLNVYGSETAYTGAADKQGTLISDIADVKGGYTYIGMRSESGTLNVSKITIIYEPTTKKNPELSFDQEKYEAETSESGFWLNPEPTAAEGLELDYENDFIYTSSDPAVATIAANGDVTIEGPGTTIITAKFKGNAEYLYGEASYTLNVKAVATSLAQYQKLASKSGATALMNCKLLVTYVNGNYIYVTDASKKDAFALINQAGLSYVKDDIIPAGWNAKTQITNGLTQIVPVDASEMKKATQTGTYTIPNIGKFGDIDANMVNQIVEIEEVTFNGSTTGTYNGYAYTFYNQFGVDPVEAGEYNMTVAVSINGTTLRLLPIEYRLDDEKHLPTFRFMQHYDGLEGEIYPWLDDTLSDDDKYAGFTPVDKDANNISLEGGKFLYVKFYIPEDSPESHKVYYRFTLGDVQQAQTKAPARVAARAGENNTETPEVNVGDNFVEYKGGVVHPQSDTNASSTDYKNINGLEYYTENGSGVRTSTKSVAFSGGQITGIEDLFMNADDADAKYYNLQGVRIMHPAKGEVYIRIVGKKASKVVFY